MSHRVTTETSIKNQGTALEAFTAAGIKHTSKGGNKYEIRAGKSVGTLDLDTGVITGDTDRWHDQDFDVLRQSYAEVTYVAELRRQGASIQERTVNQEGDIVITYQTTG